MEQHINMLDTQDINNGQAWSSFDNAHHALNNNITQTSASDGNAARSSNNNSNVALSVTLQPESVFATRLANQFQQQRQQQQHKNAFQDLNNRFSLYPVNDAGSFNLAGGTAASACDARLGRNSTDNLTNNAGTSQSLTLNPRSYENLASLAALQNRKNDNVYVSSQRTVASGPVLGTSNLLQSLQRNNFSLSAHPPTAVAASNLSGFNDYPSVASASNPFNFDHPFSAFLDNSDVQSVASERLSNTMSVPRFDGSVADPNVNRFSFPMKLHDMLSRPEYSHIICWLDNGKSWMVLDQTNLEKQVLRRYFRHGKYSSFSRQVNGWGFMRITSGNQRNAYYHELFVRDNPRQSMLMRRQYATTATSSVSSDGKPHTKKSSKSKKAEKHVSERKTKPAQPRMDDTRSTNAFPIELSRAGNGIGSTTDTSGPSSVGASARNMPPNLLETGQDQNQWEQNLQNPQTSLSAHDLRLNSSGPHVVSINSSDLGGRAEQQSELQRYQSYEQRWLSLDAMVNKRAEEANELQKESNGAQTDAQDLFARLLSQGNNGSSTASFVPQPNVASYEDEMSGKKKAEMTSDTYIQQIADQMKSQINYPVNNQLSDQLSAQLNANHQQQSDQNDYLNNFLRQCAMANAQGQQQQQLQQLQQQLQQRQQQINDSAVAQLNIGGSLSAYSPKNNIQGVSPLQALGLGSYQQKFQDPPNDLDLQEMNLNLYRSTANNQILLNQLANANGGNNQARQLGINMNLDASNLGASQNSTVHGYNAGYPDTNIFDGYDDAE